MIPLRDENPTRRPAVVTIVLILLCTAVFVFVQPAANRSLDEPDAAEVIEEIEFSYEYAAVPCELSQGRALTADEIRETQVNGDDEACAGGAQGPTPFPDKRLWTSVLVSMFLHGSWFHLAGNMLFLWVFGNNIEDHMGSVRYLGFYLFAGALATVAHVLVQLDSTVPVIGASGAIAGVMGAYLVWFPWARVRTLLILGFIPVWPRLPAWLLLGIWFVTQFFTASDARVAWMSHAGGFGFGVLVAWVVRRDDRFRNKLWAHRYRTVGPHGWDNRVGPT